MPHFTPKMNTGTNIFVFGSNETGVHRSGAAHDAIVNWGAEYDQGFGRQGQSFAIPTKDENIQTLPLNAISPYVYGFLRYARLNPQLTFLVTEIGCGLAGYKPKQIAPMFEGAPFNCVLPESFAASNFH